MAIPQNEWLHKAKAIPVGTSRRVRHSNEPSSAMVVWNTPDRWVAKCYRCHESAVVEKTMVKLGALVPEPYFQRIPKDCLQVSAEAGSKLYSERLGRFFPPPVPHYWLYSKEADRLIMPLHRGYVGRSLRVDHPTKWIAYADANGEYPTYGMFPDTVSAQSEHVGRVPVVLTEDALSMNAVRYACGDAVLAVTTLGTRISDALMAVIVGLQLPVIFFYDGDDAGEEGAESGRKRLRGLGIKSTEVFPPAGLDPKDLSSPDIRDLIMKGVESL